MLREWIAALLVGAIAALLLASPAPIRAEEAEYQQSLGQAKVYLKQERYREAVQELRKALSTKQGDKSFEAHFLYAQASFKVYDISQAVEFARLATELTSDPRELSQAQDLYNYLTLAFGKVEFIAGEGELREGYIIVVPKEPILDAEIQGYFDQKVKPIFDQKRSLPWLMWLPTLLFEINGNEFSVIPGETIQVEAGFTEEVVAAQEATVQRARNSEMDEQRRRESAAFNPEIRLGYSAVTSGMRREDGMLTALALDLTGMKEFRAIGVGGFVTGTFGNVSTRGADASAQGSADIMAGAMARVHIFLPGRLSLFPALGVGWGTVGGASVYCDSSTAVVGGGKVTYSDCASAPAEAWANPFQAYSRVAGFGGVARLDLLIERAPGSIFRGVVVGLHSSALRAGPFSEATRTSDVLVANPDTGEATTTTVTEELILSGIESSLVVRAGLMVGARLAF